MNSINPKKRTALTFALAVALLLLTACGAPTPTTTQTPAADAPTTDAPTTAAPITDAPTTDTPPLTLPTPTTQPTANPQASFDPATTPLALEKIVNGLTLPVFVTHAGDGSDRLFIIEKQGAIRIVQDGALLETPFLDIRDRVGAGANEQGLLGMAFDPNYAETGHFWVEYTNKDGNTVVSRFQATAEVNSADPASEFLTLTFAQPYRNHNGGMIAFGPDGMLWIGTGDGGSAGDPQGNGQNPQTLLGKMLRLDVTSDPAQPYLIPSDNPAATGTLNGATTAPEIWATGLRNPWRYSFDRLTGDLWIADVGQNIWEEVNFVPAGTQGGLNFGWKIMEGAHCYVALTCDQTGLTLPVAEYDHSGHCSITGGYVYRGAAYPQLHGVYFYGDYCSGRVWALYPDGNGGWQNPVAFDAPLTLSSFGEDEAGELYLVDFSGSVHRLVVAP